VPLVHAREDDVQAEPDREVEDHAHDRRGDRREGGAQGPVASQRLDVRRTEKDPQKARHERDPHRDERADHACQHRRHPARVPVGAQEADELHDHDQGTGCGLRQPEPVEHLSGTEPSVGLDRTLRDVGQHRVGASERDDGGLREEQAFLDEDRLGAEHHAEHDHR
jgi:hypothetical protein